MRTPCCECPYRKLTCHDRCEDYIRFNEKLLAAKNAFKGKHEADAFIITMTIKRRKGAHVR